MHERRIEQPARYGDITLESVLRVEHCDVKFFDGKILQSLSEDFVHIPRTPHGRTLIPLFRSHSPTQLQRCVHRDCASGSYTGKTSQRSNGLRRQSTQRSPRARENLVADSNCRIFFRSGAKEYREQLGGAKCSRAVRLEALARPLGRSDFMNVVSH
jgi:hypothetical protein